MPISKILPLKISFSIFINILLFIFLASLYNNYILMVSGKECGDMEC